MPKIIGGSLREHREQTRRRLFDALSSLMADRGFDTITLADIATTAGVGRTAVYNHFADKEALLVAFIADETDRYATLLQRRLDEIDDPVEQLRQYVRAQVRLDHDRRREHSGLQHQRDRRVGLAQADVVAQQEPARAQARLDRLRLVRADGFALPDPGVGGRRPVRGQDALQVDLPLLVGLPTLAHGPEVGGGDLQRVPVQEPVEVGADVRGVAEGEVVAARLGDVPEVLLQPDHDVGLDPGRRPGARGAVEGEIDVEVAATFLQRHPNTTFYVDRAAGAELTRIKTPWLIDEVVWTQDLIVRAVIWLSQRSNKAILKLTQRDYADARMSSLVAKFGSPGEVNGKVFNALGAKIRGKSKLPTGRTMICFSPHPDDDVISMGGILRKVTENDNDVTVAYMTSGNIAVFDHDVRRYIDFLERLAVEGIADADKIDALAKKAHDWLSSKTPGEVDIPEIQDVKRIIREAEAVSGIETVGLPRSAARFHGSSRTRPRPPHALGRDSTDWGPGEPGSSAVITCAPVRTCRAARWA